MRTMVEGGATRTTVCPRPLRRLRHLPVENGGGSAKCIYTGSMTRERSSATAAAA